MPDLTISPRLLQPGDLLSIREMVAREMVAEQRGLIPIASVIDLLCHVAELEARIATVGGSRVALTARLRDAAITWATRADLTAQVCRLPEDMRGGVERLIQEALDAMLAAARDL